ncbi:MAG: LD-carboxypeptidase [Candidatus Marsarchaeota archaeon]|nr:LD-carboxypeptidase [Candidatus Marsarchaeota archaeon]MCL5102050.1 LD-carboxypeptidase [Candidatus Marsarchaeota archaeon]
MHEPIIKPPRLRKGGTIRIIAPSSAATSTSSLPKAVKFLEKQGFKVSLATSMIRESPTRYLTAGDATRKNEIENAFRSDKYDAVMVLQGGAGSIDILNNIDYDVIKDHPKVFIGYSDITLLQLAFMRITHMASFQGPMLVDLTEEDGSALETNWNNLINIINKGEEVVIRNPTESGWAKSINDGKAKGQLMGGNLTVFSLVLGTKYIPDSRGKILFFEDVNVEPWMLDNLLASLVMKGVFKKANGIVFGQLPNYSLENISDSQTATSYLVKHLFIEDYINATMHSTLQDLLTNKIARKPSFIEFACCHGKYITTLPMGIKVLLDAEQTTLTMLEPGVE